MSITIAAAAPRDLDAIAPLLGAAFRHDPHLRGLLPASDDAERRLTLLYRMLAGHHLRASRPIDLALDGDELVGAAVWQPPTRRHQNRIGAGDIVTLARVFGSRLPDAGRESSAVARVRPAEPHWYLAAIGTSERARGTGAGRALLEHGLRRADRGGFGSHLEAATRELVPLCERFGWIDRGEIESPTPAHAVAMWRPPADA